MTSFDGALAEISGGVVRIGVLTDLSGPFADWAGSGVVEAVGMAVDDFGHDRTLPFKIELVSADFQLKPDVATSIARRWLDQGVDAIVDVPQSGAALAVNGLLRGSHAAFLVTGAQHDELTTVQCSPNTVQWTFDSYSLMSTTVKTLATQDMKTWFFLAVDLAGGKSMLDAADTAIAAAGGTVIASVRNPVNTSDFSSYLLQAMTSGAKAIGIIEGGSDLIHALKQAQEFGATKFGQKLAVGFAQLSDIKAIGLQLGQGLIFTEAFYWDLDEAKRSFAKRFAARNGGRYPSSVQAGAYSATLHYLKAVEGAHSDDGPSAIARMKEIPVDDPLFAPGVVRRDGRMVHNMYLVEVKRPEESRGEWDFYKVLREVPGDDAFRPMSRDCPLVSNPR